MEKEKEIPKRQNTISREKLIAAAKKLFYEQGYEATTLAQISNESGINNGLITYYFGSKVNLASVINTAYLLEMRNEIARQLYEVKKGYNLELGVAIEQRILMATKFENKNLMRFNLEYTKDKAMFEGHNEKREHYYKLQQRLINPQLSDLDLKLYEVCGASITTNLARAYANHYVDCSTAYLKDYAIREIFHFMCLPDYQTEALVEESSLLEEQISVKIVPYFKVVNGKTYK